MARRRRPLAGPLKPSPGPTCPHAKASAGQLAGLADDVHLATRLPKHLIMGAVVNVLDRYGDEVEAEAQGPIGK